MTRGIALISIETDEQEGFVVVPEGRSLDKVEDGMNINLNHDKFYTRQVTE